MFGSLSGGSDKDRVWDPESHNWELKEYAT